jgi:hypothetical protein
MKRLWLSLLLAFALAGPVAAQDPASYENLSTTELEAQAPQLHPAALYMLAARLLDAGRGQEAANWMYAGQLRYRFLLEAENATGEKTALFAALTEQVGRPVNEYIAGDIDEWLAAMDWALEWDAANPNPLTSKVDHAQALSEVRAGLEALRAQVAENRETIRQDREANGLPNR